jgi:hypothetical protein
MTSARCASSVLFRYAAVLPIVALLAWTAAAPAAERGMVLREMPFAVSAESRYLIYLHGRIVEDQGIRPTDPRFGVYEVEAILATLAEHGLQVISEVRPPNADPLQYAQRTDGEVRVLLAAGVPPSHITIVGMSKGGAIAILTASILQNDQVRFVLLASCGDEILVDSELAIAGRVLSIYEAADEMAFSCQPLFRRSPGSSVFEEIRLKTGLSHGEFYVLREEWIEPTVRWALAGG